MSGGMEDSRRAERAQEEIEAAGRLLALALAQVNDAVFGLDTAAPGIVNEALRAAGIRAVLVIPGRQRVAPAWGQAADAAYKRWWDADSFADVPHDATRHDLEIAFRDGFERGWRASSAHGMDED